MERKIKLITEQLGIILNKRKIILNEDEKIEKESEEINDGYTKVSLKIESIETWTMKINFDGIYEENMLVS